MAVGEKKVIVKKNQNLVEGGKENQPKKQPTKKKTIKEKTAVVKLFEEKNEKEWAEKSPEKKGEVRQLIPVPEEPNEDANVF